jgi:hypothetical protein
MLKLLLLSQYLACNESNTEDTSDELKLDLPAEKEEEVVEEEVVEEEVVEDEEFFVDADFTIDASDSTVWIYFDLASGIIVEPETPEDSTEWDLKFQRYDIGVNGGVNGTAGVMVAIEEGVYDSFDNITILPELSWNTDVEDSDDDGKPEYVFQNWFDYDISTHVLTPKNIVYFIKTSEQNYRFRIVDYYGPNGASGYMSFDVAQMNTE